VHSFGEECPWGDEPGVEIVRAEGAEIPGPKWRALHLLLGRREEQFKAYDYVCFADDDLAADAPTLNRMFDLCAEYGLDLAQPALTADSHMGFWGITMENRSFRLRYTSFVEVMAPIFSQRFLQRCAPSFNENVSGFGLDLLWSSWIPSPLKMGILDEAAVKHTRAPRSGELYQALSGQGINPDQELVQLIRKWNLVKASEQPPGQVILPATFTHGGVLRDGTLLRISSGQGIELMRGLLNGFPEELIQTRHKILNILLPVMQLIAIS
jgi:hypothetical protein